jgi:DNA repair ATPase RecN
MTTKKRKIAATNLGPIREFEAELEPGINLLRGSNGAGKSHILAAIARAAGADVPIEVNDDATRGEFRLDGAVLFSVTRSKSSKGSAGKVNVSLASVSPLADLIEPGLKSKEANETRRIQALLQLVDLKVTPETISTFVNGNEDALEWIEDEEGLALLCQLNPVEVADRVRRALHKRKREFEAEADRAQGRYQAVKVEKPERLIDTPVAEARAKYDEMVGDLREAQGGAAQRKAREIERQEIATTLGERPDVEKAQQAEAECYKRVEEAQEAVNELARQLAVARTNLAHAEDEAEEASRWSKVQEQDAARWEKGNLILEGELTGATEADVAEAGHKVELARTILESAQTAEQYRKSLEAAELHRTERDGNTKRATEFETLAKAVPSRLGGLLADAGLPNLTVEDGVLTVIHENGDLEPFARLSSGEKARLAMPIFIKANPSRLVALPQQIWESLDKQNAEELAAILKEFDVVAVSELPSERGDELRVDIFGGEHGNNSLADENKSA